MAKDAVLVNEERRPCRNRVLVNEYVIEPAYPTVHVGEQGERYSEFLCKGFMRRRAVNANTQNLGIQLVEGRFKTLARW